MAQDLISEQLARILSSPLFSQSPRLSAFLRHVVREAAAGQSASLKEYSIGVEVFERGKDFDPRIDNIVRIQAAKLRSRLAEYYGADGVQDPVVITVPKGSYVPEIREREAVQVVRRTPDRSRIAVLPFLNMSADQENEYFSDGLTEEIINRLAGISSLQVVARTSVFSFKGRNEDLREVGLKLDVGTVLEGSVRRAGEQLRVTAQLIDVETGFHIFSRTYDRTFRDIFALQDELAGAVAEEIAPSKPQAGLEIAAGKTATNLNAYNAYLRGLFAMSNRFEDLSTCMEHFREALAHDPNYAPAWAGMAHGYFLLAWFYRSPFEIVMPLSQEAARKSVALDPDSALGLHSLATAECALEWKWASAELKFTRAIRLQPSLAIGYIEYALFCLVPQLRFADACEIVERALALDPFNPLIHALAIHIYGRLGRYDQMLRQYETALNVAPQYPPIHAAAGMAHEWNGHLEKAVEAYREACRLSGDAAYPLSCLGHALARTGDTAGALRIIEQLRSGPIVAGSDLARVYCGLRDADVTLSYLENDADVKSLYLLRVTGDPRFDWLAPEPRFQRLLERMGLPTG